MYLFRSSEEWRDAYTNTNYAEDFVEVVVLWVYLVGKQRDDDLNGDQLSCIKEQLGSIAKYLPTDSIKIINCFDRSSAKEDENFVLYS
jgi:hypothetical protein